MKNMRYKNITKNKENEYEYIHAKYLIYVIEQQVIHLLL